MNALARSITRISEVVHDLERVALRSGAIRVGVSGIDDEHAELFRRWIDEDRNAGMGYLEKSAGVRANPRDRFPWARSVVVLLVPYEPVRPAAPPDTIAPGIARYAQGDDYHDVVDSMLRQLETTLKAIDSSVTTRRYADTGPLSDRSMAAQAGLGWIGRNGMLIDPEHGSWIFIGTLLTSLENDLDPARIMDRCGDCTRCLEACPTEAILPGSLVDSARCISYLTIEHRGAIDPRIASRLSGNLFGCDICNEVCPWNDSAPEGLEAFRPRQAYQTTLLADLLRMGQPEISHLFKGSAVKRARRVGMIRNALLVKDQLTDLDLEAVAGEGDPGIVAAAASRR